LALKQRIRNKVTSPLPSLVTIEDSDDAAEAKVRRPAYIADAFLAAAKKYSCDEGTAYEGGLLGTLVPQGYCQAPELDRACFEVPLGEICGPIESECSKEEMVIWCRCWRLGSDDDAIRRRRTIACKRLFSNYEGT